MPPDLYNNMEKTQLYFVAQQAEFGKCQTLPVHFQLRSQNLRWYLKVLTVNTLFLYIFKLYVQHCKHAQDKK